MKSTALLVFLAGALLTSTGCVSARYKSAPSSTPAAVVLNLTSTPAQSAAVEAPPGVQTPAAALPPVEVIVHSVIGFHGPGSWKRDAYWDEYVVSVINRDGDPIVIESATVTDFHGDPNGTGDNPWQLEKLSRSRQDELNRIGKTVLVQVGSGTLVAGASGTMIIMGAFAGSAVAVTAGLALFPAYIASSVVRNVSSRHDIAAEFSRRRIALPAIVAPGERKQGSLFFRIAPGPQRLALQCRVGGESRDLAVNLAPLAGLHLKSAAVPRSLETHP